MKRVPKIVYLTLAVLIAVGGVVLNGIDRVRAVEPGVYIVPIDDATKGFNCGDLNDRTDEVFGGVTSDFGFKLGGIPDLGLNTYPFITTGDNELTGGAPSDPSNSVTLEGLDNFSFNWWATLGIDAVIVKASTDAEVYVYIPEAFEGGPLYSVMKADGSYFAISHIEFCYDYELTATKTAETSYTRTYTWDISKVADGDYDGFIGDPAFYHDYTVSVDRSETDSDFAVAGTITVSNPTPFDVNFSVTDLVAPGVSPTVDCPSYSLTPGGSVVCTYSAPLTGAVNGTNTATITSNTTGVAGAVVTKDYTFGEPTTVVGDPTVNVTDDKFGYLNEVSDDADFAYTQEFQCEADPAKYVDGVWTMEEFVNTATIDETGQNDSAKVNLTCYAPVLDKVADTSWEEKYDWTITKESGADYDGFIGDPAFNHGYVVSVDQTITSQNFKVYGSIYVSNPLGSPDNMIVSLADELAAGVFATVDCGSGATSVTVAPGDTESCTYSGFLAAKTDGTNTATGTFNSMAFVTTEPYAFGDPTIVGYPTINVTDSFEGALGSASGDKTFDTYFKSFQCEADPAKYVDGVWTMEEFVNTATIDETGQNDSAEVNLTCYAPVVSKDAAGTFDKTYTWDVEKTVDPTGDSGMPGDTLSWTWTVTVTKIPAADKNFAVSGTISVSNPHPTSAMTVALEDVLSDGTVATIEYCATPAAEFVPIDGQISVPALTTAVCWYTASPATKAELNTVTATFNAIDFAANAVIGWTGNESGDSAELDDDQNPAFPITITEGGTWTYSDSHTCSTYRWDYDQETHRYNSEENNTATVTWEDGSDSASAKTSYACKAGFVDLIKLTNGLEDPEEVWTFNLYKGGYEGSLVASGTTPPTLLFADLALPFYTEYTMCEIGAPAGWISAWTMNGESVTPYNPDYPENLGNLCVDFYVGTTEIVDGKLRITGPTTVSFVVDNQQGGGDPRTPGYWKNWNTCTGGNQQYTAAANGGWAEGFWLLDDVLGLTDAPSPGIVWDDILSDEFEFPINSCALGVSILNTRDYSTGKQLAGDPGYNLAKHLLAAQANLIAGACMPYPETGVDINDIILQAETLLDEYNFDATGVGIDKKKDKADAAYALELASILDNYNNGLYCGSTYIP